MKYWLVKSEPYKYSWDDMIKDNTTYWDGVRNYQARNNLKSMKKGDLVLFYHSNVGKEIVGITSVIKEFYQDPTTEDPKWVVVDLKVKSSLKNKVSLEDIKKDQEIIHTLMGNDVSSRRDFIVSNAINVLNLDI